LNLYVQSTNVVGEGPIVPWSHPYHVISACVAVFYRVRWLLLVKLFVG
jgi:hypothetical protein